jgi:transaldolase
MKIFGAGSIEDIKKCSDLGVAGIFTNPQGFDQYFQGKATLEEITQEILRVSEAPIFIQIHGESVEALVMRARQLHGLSSRVGFKIIADEKGFRAIRELEKENIRCIATCLFTVSQAAVAAMVGAYGICPFVSRAREIGMDPITIVKTIKEGYRNLPRAPVIIAVSLKNLTDVETALAAGADAVGMRYPLIKDMMGHILTSKAESLFAQNWANVKGEDVSYLNVAVAASGAAE